jgi:hypothetical protein
MCVAVFVRERELEWQHHGARGRITMSLKELGAPSGSGVAIGGLSLLEADGERGSSVDGIGSWMTGPWGKQISW